MSIAPAERVETSLEEIAELDFEPEVPCEWTDCEHAAAWWSITPCCSAHHGTCDQCRMEWLDGIAKIPLLVYECITCGGAVWASGIRFAPIKATP